SFSTCESARFASRADCGESTHAWKSQGSGRAESAIFLSRRKRIKSECQIQSARAICGCNIERCAQRLAALRICFCGCEGEGADICSTAPQESNQLPAMFSIARAHSGAISVAVFALCAGVHAAASPSPLPPEPDRVLAREIFKE